MTARTLLQELKEAEERSKSAYELKYKGVKGKLNLSNRTVEVALIFTHCTFTDEVDLRYCEFQRAVKFCNCTFVGDFDSGDDTDSRTIYRKNLVCNDSIFRRAAKFRGIQCEGRALFRNAKFCRWLPLGHPVYRGDLQRPPADFTAASIEGGLDCTGAHFHGAATFNLLDCGVASFEDARFLRTYPLRNRTHHKVLEKPPVDFTAASFKSLNCENAVFKGAVSFRGVECGARASFQKAHFEQAALLRDKVGTLPDEIGRTVPVDFTRASFGYLNALGARFDGAASFNGLKCAGDAVFKGARFCRSEREKLSGYEKALSQYEERLEQLPDTRSNEYKQLNAERERLSSMYERLRDEINIDLKYSEFRSSLLLQNAICERPVTLKRAKITDTLNMNRANFQDGVSLYGTRIGRLRFRDPHFTPESVDLRECAFDTLASFTVVVPSDRNNTGVTAKLRKALYEAADSLRSIFDGTPRTTPTSLRIEEPHNVLAKIMDRGKFSMDPYLQLEKDYIRKGDEAQARKIYYRGRRRARNSATWGPPKGGSNTAPENATDRWSLQRHVWDRFLGFFTGYGVQTWRLVFIAVLFVAFGWWWFSSPDHLEAVDQSTPSATTGGALMASTGPTGERNPYEPWRRLTDRLTYSVDLFLPVVKLGADERWVPEGWPSRTYATVHMFFGWLVVPLLLAALAGILKR